MWRSKELFDTPVYYLAFHGRPGAVRSLLERIEADKLCEAFAGYGAGGYKNLVYFACCNVLRGKKGQRFARQFLKASGVQRGDRLHHDGGLDGSLVCDLLFLHRFYGDPSPWRNLRQDIQLGAARLSGGAPARVHARHAIAAASR